MSTTNAKHMPGELAVEYINRADAPYDPAGPAIADLHDMQAALARVTARCESLTRQRDQCVADLRAISLMTWNERQQGSCHGAATAARECAISALASVREQEGGAL